MDPIIRFALAVTQSLWWFQERLREKCIPKYFMCNIYVYPNVIDLVRGNGRVSLLSEPHITTFCR